MILCIPGPWRDRQEFLHALIAAHAGRYIFAGAILMDTESKDHVELEWCARDGRMREAFRCTCRDESTLSAIESHGSVLYLQVTLDVPEQRERILKYTDVLRKAGGIAVKLENCGLAHSWQRWFDGLSSPFQNEHYRAVVVQCFDEDGAYSCGMHHFGLPDATIDVGGDEGLATLQAFNVYVLMESPNLQPGHTFSKDASSPRCRLHRTPDDRFEPDDLFHNPHGLWRLQEVI